MPSHKVLHIGITKCSGDGKDTINAIVQDKATGISDAFPFIVVTPFVIVGQP